VVSRVQAWHAECTHIIVNGPFFREENQNAVQNFARSRGSPDNCVQSG